MTRLYLVSLGCDKNRIDAEIMAKRLQDAGYAFSDDPYLCDAAIVNTCGFIEAAKKEAIDEIFAMVRVKEDRGSRMRAVIVTGCLAERYRDQLADSIPEADAVIGIGKNREIVSLVRSALDGGKVTAYDRPERLDIESRRLISAPRHYAYLKIAEGCSNRCTYCAIPSIRGAYRSRALLPVVDEAERLVSGGAKELILIAQDTTAYGRDLAERSSLSELLRALVKIDGVWKIRLLYAYPDHMTGELLDVMAENERIAGYIDLPMQHADGGLLRRMGRFGDEPRLRRMIGDIRAAIPGVSLRSSFIVGFPGESERQFSALMDFLEEVRLDRAGCFAFSSEEGTPAHRMREAVPEEVKQSRAETFMLHQTRILAEKQRERIGMALQVICDGYDAGTDRYITRTEYDAPEIDTVLYLQSPRPVAAGEVIRVTVTGTDGCDLFGEPAADL